jgi:hypothetical protein
MADAIYSVNTQGAVALAATTAKTALFVLAPSGHGMSLKKWRIAFDGVTASAVPVFWEVNYLTGASNSTPGTGNTSQSANVLQTSGRAITSAFLAGSACTAEPTVQTNVDAALLTPNGGVIVYDFPLGDEPDAAVSAGFCIRLTAPAAVNVRVSMFFKRI